MAAAWNVVILCVLTFTLYHGISLTCFFDRVRGNGVQEPREAEDVTSTWESTVNSALIKKAIIIIIIIVVAILAQARRYPQEVLTSPISTRPGLLRANARLSHDSSREFIGELSEGGTPQLSTGHTCDCHERSSSRRRARDGCSTLRPPRHSSGSLGPRHSSG